MQMIRPSYRLVIFDFDGTLADSYPFFLRVFNQLADEYAFQRIDTATAPELRHCDVRQVMQKVAMAPHQLPLVAKRFIDLMQQAGTVPLFESVEETLLTLRRAGLTLTVVSSNSLANVVRTLGPENTQCMRHLECGVSVFGKAVRIRKILKRTGIDNRDAIYIGDQITDIEAARQEQIAFGAVSWGYASIESLRKQDPEEEFGHVRDLQRLARYVSGEGCQCQPV